jgi:hypothetical protein
MNIETEIHRDIRRHLTAQGYHLNRKIKRALAGGNLVKFGYLVQIRTQRVITAIAR